MSTSQEILSRTGGGEEKFPQYHTESQEPPPRVVTLGDEAPGNPASNDPLEATRPQCKRHEI